MVAAAMLRDLSTGVGLSAISEVHTEAVAGAVAALLEARPVAEGTAAWTLGLTGDMGMGKSVVARAFLRHFGYDEAMPSPTYSLVQAYQDGVATIWHIDLFRLKTAHELYALGIEEMCADCGGILLCEWPMRGLQLLCDIDFELRLSAPNASAQTRQMRLIPTTSRAKSLLQLACTA